MLFYWGTTFDPSYFVYKFQEYDPLPLLQFWREFQNRCLFKMTIGSKRLITRSLEKEDDIYLMQTLAKSILWDLTGSYNVSLPFPGVGSVQILKTVFPALLNPEMKLSDAQIEAYMVSKSILMNKKSIGKKKFSFLPSQAVAWYIEERKVVNFLRSERNNNNNAKALANVKSLLTEHEGGLVMIVHHGPPEHFYTVILQKDGEGNWGFRVFDSASNSSQLVSLTLFSILWFLLFFIIGK